MIVFTGRLARRKFHLDSNVRFAPSPTLPARRLRRVNQQDGPPKPMPDPAPLLQGDWSDNGLALKLLWINLLLMATAAISLGFAHAIIPSAVDSGTFSRTASRFRPFLYVIGTIAIVIALINAYFIIDISRGWIEDIYPRWYQ